MGGNLKTLTTVLYKDMRGDQYDVLMLQNLAETGVNSLKVNTPVATAHTVLLLFIEGNRYFSINGMSVAVAGLVHSSFNAIR